MKNRHSSRFVRLGVASLLTGAIAIGVPANPIAQAALGGLTPFEIDGNTVPEDPTNLDWTNKSNVTVENDHNYTGPNSVPTDVANDGTALPEHHGREGLRVMIRRISRSSPASKNPVTSSNRG